MLALVRAGLALAVRLITGVRGLDERALPEGPAVVFANHGSHFDTLVVWAALPPSRRARLRPVAALDYWGASRLRRAIAEQILRALLIARKREDRTSDPIDDMVAALDAGETLLVFPEGTRSVDGTLGRFRGGLHAIATRRPALALVPAHLENLSRVLPKGELVPLPLICSLRIGAPLERIDAEPRETFLARARDAVAELGGVAVAGRTD